MASASADCTVIVWDTKQFKAKRVLRGHVDAVYAVAFSPDNQKVVSASEDSTLRIWDLVDGRCETILTGHKGPVYSVSVSPNGKEIASAGDDGKVIVWDSNTGTIKRCCKLNQTGSWHPAWHVAYSPDGRLLAAGYWGTVHVWNTSDGTLRYKVRAHHGRIYSLAFSPDSRRIATASWDKTFKLLEASSGEEVLLLGSHKDDDRWGRAVAFGPTGRFLVTATDQSIQIWDSTLKPTGDKTIRSRELPQIERPSKDATHIDADALIPVKTLEEERKEQEATLTAAIQAKPKDAKAWQNRAFFHMRHQSWKKAADDWNHHVQLPKGGGGWQLLQAALCNLMAEDVKIYCHHCKAYTKRPRGTKWTLPLRPFFVYVSALGSSVALDSERILQDAEAAVKADPNRWDNLHAHLCVLYRLKRYKECLKVSAQCQKLAQNPSQQVHDALWKAMILHQFGERRQAKKVLAEAVKRIDTELPGRDQILRGIHWSGFTFHLVRREAEQLILPKQGTSNKIPEPKIPPTPTEAIRQALSHPDGPASQVALAEVHLGCGYTKDAQQCLQKAMKQLDQLASKYPQHTSRLRSYRARALSMLGQLHLQQNQYQQAEKAYRQAVELYPLTSIQLGWGKALNALGRDKEAQVVLGKVFRTLSRSARSLNSVAWRLATDPNPKVRNSATAVQMARKAVALEPKKGTYHNTLGVALYRAGQWKQALATLQKAMALRDGGDPFDWFFVAMTHHQLGNKEQARQWFDRATKHLKQNKVTSDELVRFEKEARALIIHKK